MKPIPDARLRLLVAAAAAFLFIGLCLLYTDYLIDDAFIDYRFADNFARGWGWTWNYGDPPVRGFTSFVWTLLLAAASALGISPVAASKTLGALAVVGIIALTARAGRRLSPSALGLVLAGIAANGAFAFVVSEGLETGLAALLLAALSVAGLRLASGPAGLRAGLIFFGLGLLAFWTRPDAAVFLTGLTAGLLLLKAARREWASVLALSLAGAAAAVALAGLLYWHDRHFGDIFPTSYYIKMAGQHGMNPRAVRLLVSFIAIVLLPVWVAALALARDLDRRRAVEILPLAAGVLTFFLFNLYIDPIQGFNWRFLFPVYPAVVLALVHLVSRPGATPKPRWPVLANVAAYALALALTWNAWPENKNNNSLDLQRVGRALAGLGGRMFVTESGAVPYYSGWDSRDLVGLTWAPTAREGLKKELLEEFKPDLVLVHEPSGFYRPHLPRKLVLNDYMVAQGFIAVAAVRKCPGQYHFYFARRGSPLLPEVMARLRSVPGVEYGNLKELMGEPRLAIAGPGN